MSWLLNRYEAKTLALLIGFLIGSLYVIWPYQNRTYKEIISKKKIIEYTSPQARQLRSGSADKDKPEYQRLGEVINPDAGFDELKQVELLTVKQKLINSQPFVPYYTVKGAGTNHFSSGLWGMIIGLCMVVGLDYVRGKG